MYQKNLMIALFIGAGLHLMILASYLTVKFVLMEPPATGEVAEVIKIWKINEIPPPIPINPDKRIEDIEIEPGTLPKFGIIETVDSMSAEKHAFIPSRRELAFAVRNGSGDGEGLRPGERVVVDIDPNDILKRPNKDEWMSVQREPEAIALESPLYPPLAEKAGLGAVLIMRVLVDTNGDVIDASVESCSYPGVGFEEAALAAAMKGKWTPALQNNRAVMCWVSYRIEFEPN